MKPPYTQAIPEVAAELHTSLEGGLTITEAQQRLRRYGPNLLEKQQQKSLWRILLDQLASPIVWLLIGAGTLAFAFGEFPEGIAIIIVILINTLIGFFMEWQALRSMQELRKMGRAKSTVWRSGKQQQIDSVQLVPGDLLILRAGDLVTADARLVEQHNLAVKESALTGESVQEHKHIRELPPQTPLADRDNSVYKGTVITRGNGKAIVVATGKHTELGKIAELAQTAEKEATPLDKRLNRLSRKLIWLTLAITLIIFLAGVARGSDWLLMIETAIALAVAALPEGLPIIATITLAMGMVLLARKNAIVKTLRAVQTLGETNVIFTDKTGTLTENDMYLKMAAFPEGRFPVAEEQQNGKPPQHDKLELLLKIGALCNDATYQAGTASSTGDPIEVALLRASKSHERLRKQYPRRAEIPFDADLKMMGTVHLTPEGRYLICAKGAAEAVLKQCRHMLDPDGEIVPVTSEAQWLDQVNELAAEGYRVLCFAFRESDSLPGEQGFLHDLVFVGLGGFIDPARKEVREAVESCKEAGIKVVMVTGDHPETAGHIAEQVGIVEDGRAAIKIHGNELQEDGGDEAYRNRLVSTHIFARTNPAQKLHLIQTYQQQRYTVGMTGDGVNDAPALKKADVGIAMGQRGTEAAKEAADIILKDDAFGSIVLAVRQGRIIFNNIRQFVVYLLSCNLSEILVVGTASFLGIPLPLLPLQILFLNMVTDVFPALALGMNKGEWDIMKTAPRRPDEPLIPRQLWTAIVIYGLSMTLAVLGLEFVCLYALQLSDTVINNMTFYTIILVQLWNVFNLPSAQVSFFRNEVTRNRYVWLALLVSIGIVVIAWGIAPARAVLNLTSTLPLSHWALIFGFSLSSLLFTQLLKRGFGVVK